MRCDRGEIQLVRAAAVSSKSIQPIRIEQHERSTFGPVILRSGLDVRSGKFVDRNRIDIQSNDSRCTCCGRHFSCMRLCDVETIVLQPPEIDRKIRDVVTDLSGLVRLDINDMRERIERRSKLREQRGIAKCYRAAPDRGLRPNGRKTIWRCAALVRPLMIEMLVPDKILEQLDGM